MGNRCGLSCPPIWRLCLVPHHASIRRSSSKALFLLGLLCKTKSRGKKEAKSTTSSRRLWARACVAWADTKCRSGLWSDGSILQIVLGNQRRCVLRVVPFYSGVTMPSRILSECRRWPGPPAAYTCPPVEMCGASRRPTPGV